MAEAQLINVPLTDSEATDLLRKVDEIQQEKGNDEKALKDVPKILLPYQAAWHEDKSEIRFASKSRRIGFSWGCLASESVMEASLAKKNGGMNQLYMGYNLRMAAEYIGDCAFFARMFGEVISRIDVSRQQSILENEKRDIVTYKITFASGFRIEALSSNPHNWRGQQGHARIDEAAFHPDLPELIKGALAFLMWGGRLDIVSTHNGEDNYFNLLMKDLQSGKLSDWSLHQVNFDDALKAGFYKRVCLVKDEEWTPDSEALYRNKIFSQYPDTEDADEELMCIPKRGSGAYFSRMLIENCWEEGIPIVRYEKPSEFVLDPDRERITENWIREFLKPIIDSLDTAKRTVYGQDFGRDGDLSVIWILQKETSELWRTVFILELRKIPFDVQKQITFYILSELPLFHHAKFDARGNGQSHAEAAAQEFASGKIDCVMATSAWYQTWFPKYKAAYESKNIVVPMSEDVVADHLLVQLVKGKPTMSEKRIKGADGNLRHGDSTIAGLMAWAAANEDGQPPAGVTIAADDDVYRPNAMQDRLTRRLMERRVA